MTEDVENHLVLHFVAFCTSLRTLDNLNSLKQIIIQKYIKTNNKLKRIKQLGYNQHITVAFLCCIVFL